MTNPKISIIITAYNIEKYIEQCIESVIGQDFSDIEIICVDDASTDDTYPIIKKMCLKDKRIHVIHNVVNCGQATARNMGCRAAIGEYIYMLDGDDLLKEDALSRLYSCAKENGLDILTFSAEVFYENKQMGLLYGKQSKIYMRTGDYQGVYTGPSLFAKMIENRDMHGNLCFQFIKREFMIEHSLYSIDGLRYGEDSPFSIYMQAERAMCIPDILYCRRFREGSIITSSKKMVHLESLLIQYTNDLFIWKSKNLADDINERIESFFVLQLRVIKKLLDEVDTGEEMVMLKAYPVAKFLLKYFLKGESLYCELLIKDIINSMKTYSDIIIYGAGDLASHVADYLLDNGISDYKVAVSDDPIETMFKNKKVHKITDFLEKKENVIVLIAVGNKYKDEIRQNLKECGFVHIVDVSKC